MSLFSGVPYGNNLIRGTYGVFSSSRTPLLPAPDFLKTAEQRCNELNYIYGLFGFDY